MGTALDQLPGVTEAGLLKLFFDVVSGVSQRLEQLCRDPTLSSQPFPKLSGVQPPSTP